MNLITAAAVSCALLFVAMVLLSLAGEWVSRRQPARRTEPSNVATGAVFALLGLLLAFTYAGAFARLDARREMIVKEVNAIGTAFLRIDLLPADAQPALREQFRAYTKQRLSYYEATDTESLLAEYAAAARLQGKIWKASVAATDSGNVATRQLVISSLNDMFDAATTRRAAAMFHHPAPVVVSLFVVALLSAVLAGYSEPRDRFRQRTQFVAFAFVVSICVYIILDMDYPRSGLINLDYINAMMQDLLNSMG